MKERMTLQTMIQTTSMTKTKSFLQGTKERGTTHKTQKCRNVSHFSNMPYSLKPSLPQGNQERPAYATEGNQERPAYETEDGPVTCQRPSVFWRIHT